MTKIRSTDSSQIIDVRTGPRTNPARPAQRPGRTLGARKAAEDDAVNPKTRRPYWDEHAPDWKDPGRLGKPRAPKSYQANVAKYSAQRKAAGDKGY